MSEHITWRQWGPCSIPRALTPHLPASLRVWHLCTRGSSCVCCCQPRLGLPRGTASSALSSERKGKMLRCSSTPCVPYESVLLTHWSAKDFCHTPRRVCVCVCLTLYTTLLETLRYLKTMQTSCLFNISIIITFLFVSRRFYPKRLKNIFIHTDGGVDHARRQPARREQLGWGVLLRDTSTLEDPGIKLATLRLTRSTS